VESFFFENSYGQATLQIDVAGWYTLGSSPCDDGLSAMVALADPDVDYSVGYHAVIAGRVGSGCSGSIGGTGDWAPFDTDEGPVFMQWAVVDGSHVGSPEVWTHEMLHTWGVWDSYRYTCGDIPPGFPFTCSGQSYGDTHTVMSAPQYGGTFGHLASSDKAHMGWIHPPTSTGGTTTLGRWETTGDAVKIRRNASTFFYVERRGTMQLRLGRSLITDNLQSFFDPYSGVRLDVSGNDLTVDAGSPDLVPPEGGIVSPRQGETVSGVIPCWVDLDDAYEVYWSDHVGRLRETVGPPFSIRVDTRDYFDGQLILKARARDIAGNQIEYRVTVEVDNTGQVDDMPTLEGVGMSDTWPRTLTFTAGEWDHEYASLEVDVMPVGGERRSWARVWMPPGAGRHSVRLAVPKQDVVLWVRPVDVNGDAGSWSDPIRSFYSVEDIQ
jgi:hypothetical protein